MVLDNKNNKIITIAQGGVPVFQFFLKGYVLRVEGDIDPNEDKVNFLIIFNTKIIYLD